MAPLSVQIITSKKPDLPACYSPPILSSFMLYGTLMIFSDSVFTNNPNHIVSIQDSFPIIFVALVPGHTFEHLPGVLKDNRTKTAAPQST